MNLKFDKENQISIKLRDSVDKFNFYLQNKNPLFLLEAFSKNNIDPTINFCYLLMLNSIFPSGFEQIYNRLKYTLSVEQNRFFNRVIIVNIKQLFLDFINKVISKELNKGNLDYYEKVIDFPVFKNSIPLFPQHTEDNLFYMYMFKEIFQNKKNFWKNSKYMKEYKELIKEKIESGKKEEIYILIKIITANRSKRKIRQLIEKQKNINDFCFVEYNDKRNIESFIKSALNIILCSNTINTLINEIYKDKKMIICDNICAYLLSKVHFIKMFNCSFSALTDFLTLNILINISRDEDYHTESYDSDDDNDINDKANDLLFYCQLILVALHEIISNQLKMYFEYSKEIIDVKEVKSNIFNKDIEDSEKGIVERLLLNSQNWLSIKKCLFLLDEQNWKFEYHEFKNKFLCCHSKTIHSYSDIIYSDTSLIGQLFQLIGLKPKQVHNLFLNNSVIEVRRGINKEREMKYQKKKKMKKEKKQQLSLICKMKESLTIMK